MSRSEANETRRLAVEVTLPRLTGYFFRLGALGFGGPVALANYMRRDLVELRGWLTEQEYDGGLAVAFSFGLAPFLLVLVSAALYARYTDNWQLRGLFYGVGPVVVALILKACWNLGRKTLRRDVAAWTMATLACAITVVVQKELTALFLTAGVLGIFVFGRSDAPGKDSPPLVPPAPA